MWWWLIITHNNNNPISSQAWEFWRSFFFLYWFYDISVTCSNCEAEFQAFKYLQFKSAQNYMQQCAPSSHLNDCVHFSYKENMDGFRFYRFSCDLNSYVGYMVPRIITNFIRTAPIVKIHSSFLWIHSHPRARGSHALYKLYEFIRYWAIFEWRNNTGTSNKPFISILKYSLDSCSIQKMYKFLFVPPAPLRERF